MEARLLAGLLVVIFVADIAWLRLDWLALFSLRAAILFAAVQADDDFTLDLNGDALVNTFIVAVRTAAPCSWRHV
jgi:hypothetical protein